MDEEQLQARNEQYARALQGIRDTHRQEINEIKRRGQRLRLWFCPLLAALFGAVAWYLFTTVHDVGMGMLYAGGSLAFLLMLLLGAMFDRPC